jgi:hypothetical protein
MKTLGVVVIILGGLVALLGYQGKIGDAWEALKGGSGSE